MKRAVGEGSGIPEHAGSASHLKPSLKIFSCRYFVATLFSSVSASDTLKWLRMLWSKGQTSAFTVDALPDAILND